ncbi:hypothetical protein DPSP01_011177 [Paraphaeosphaeria sporulosa]
MHEHSRTPQEAVFSIPELLEQILLFTDVSPITLLRARLINRTANATILSARALRRALFLDATTPSQSHQPTGGVEMNPLLERMFPPFMQTQFKRLRRRGEAETAAALGYFNFEASEDEASDTTFPLSCFTASTVLPTLERAERCRGRDLKWACLGSSYAGPCLHLPVVERCRGEEHLREVEGGIWRAMYASRPSVAVHVVEVGACGIVEHVREVGTGMNMGEVMDVLVFRRENLSCSGKKEVEGVPVEEVCAQVVECTGRRAKLKL